MDVRVTEQRLAETVRRILERCHDTAAEYGTPGNYVNGANIAGFIKVARAMVALGVIDQTPDMGASPQGVQHQQHDVAGNDVGRRDGPALTASDHRGIVRRHRTEGGDRGRGTRLLEVPHDAFNRTTAEIASASYGSAASRS